MKIFLYFLTYIKKKTNKIWPFFVLCFVFSVSLLPIDSASAAIFSKDLKGIHERFDLLESKVDGLVKNISELVGMFQIIKANDAVNLRNQADLKEEIHLLHEKLTNMSGLAETNFYNLSESVNRTANSLKEDFRKLKEFNQDFLEQERSNKEILYRNFQLDFTNLAKKIAKMVSIYKALSEEEIEKDNENIINLNKKLEEISIPVNQLIQVYKDMAVEQIFREENLVSNFNNQFIALNGKVSQLVDIYKQSISSITTSNKSNLGKVEKELINFNTKIKKMTEIFIATIKENNSALRTINKNLSKELQLINNKLSGFDILIPTEKETSSKLNPSKKGNSPTTKKE